MEEEEEGVPMVKIALGYEHFRSQVSVQNELCCFLGLVNYVSIKVSKNVTPYQRTQITTSTTQEQGERCNAREARKNCRVIPQ